MADNFRAGVEGTRRLLNRGCRRLVFIDGRDKPREGAWDGWNPELQFAETFHGMESVCRERGLSPELASWNINSDCEEMDRILRQLPGTTGTGFLIGNRSMAWEIVLRARELGIRIPEDVSLVTFPAYPATEASVRRLEERKQEWLREQKTGSVSRSKMESLSRKRLADLLKLKH